MSNRLPHAVAAAAAVFALVASPALAAAPPPAYDIYTEQVPTASGPKPDSGPATVGQRQSIPLSSTAAATLQRTGGKDRKLLKTVATSPALGAPQRLSAAGTPNGQQPSALSAAFDLGSGPTALFAALLAAAALLALGDGLRRRRQ